MTKTLDELVSDLQDEADLCRNETANDIANLLDRAAAALRELIADAERIEQKTAERCREMALWPQGIDDEQAYYGRMFAEFIEREFKLDAARQSASI